jgi:hypothetical protein
MFKCKVCSREFEDAMRAGSNLTCKPCKATYLKEWRERNPGYMKAHNDRYNKVHRDEIRLRQSVYYSDPENQAKAKARNKVRWETKRAEIEAWEAVNKAKRQRQRRQRHNERMQTDAIYAAKHRAFVRETKRLRDVIRTSQLARYFKIEIDAFYANCPLGHEVDHIEPLLRSDAMGLHVPWNLQYLRKRDNRVKGNRELS